MKQRRVRPGGAGGVQPGTAPHGASLHAEDVVMTEHQLLHTAASVAQAVDTWYATTREGDTAIITLPDTPVIWIVHRPHTHVY